MDEIGFMNAEFRARMKGGVGTTTARESTANAGDS